MIVSNASVSAQTFDVIGFVASTTEIVGLGAGDTPGSTACQSSSILPVVSVAEVAMVDRKTRDLRVMPVRSLAG
jgi:hypothetical protein